MKKGNGGIASVSRSCAVFICDVTIEVHTSQIICLPIDYSNERRWGCSNEVGRGKRLELHSNGGGTPSGYTRSNVRCSIARPSHALKMCFRFNNRKTQYLLRDTIIKLIQTQNLEYKQLTAQ